MQRDIGRAVVQNESMYDDIGGGLTLFLQRISSLRPPFVRRGRRLYRQRNCCVARAENRTKCNDFPDRDGGRDGTSDKRSVGSSGGSTVSGVRRVRRRPIVRGHARERIVFHAALRFRCACAAYLRRGVLVRGPSAGELRRTKAVGTLLGRGSSTNAPGQPQKTLAQPPQMTRPAPNVSGIDRVFRNFLNVVELRNGSPPPALGRNRLRPREMHAQPRKTEAWWGMGRFAGLGNALLDFRA